MTLRVPDRYVEGFKKLASISEEEFQSFLSGIKELKPTLNLPSAFVSSFSSNSSLKARDAQDIFDSIFSFYVTKEEQFSLGEDGIATTDDELLSILERSILDDERFDGILVDSLQNRLSSIFQYSESIEFSLLAMRESQESERLLADVKITTDVRPLFSQREPFVFRKALVMHNLKIEYAHLGGRKEFFVSLDFHDLQVLRRAVEAAEAREFALESYLRDSNVTLIPDKEKLENQSEEVGNVEVG